jgi:23S rRNA (uracil1939-C5)-methyltransferase
MQTEEPQAAGNAERPTPLPRPNRGDRLELTTTTFAFEGKAVARRPEDGYVVFVEGALANEKLIAEVYKPKGRFAEARLVEVLEPSPDRRTPVCPYFGICGGCSLQHMSYDAQLYWKTRQVTEIFERIGKFKDITVHNAIGDPNREYHYRNKMEFSFSEERWLMDDEIASGGTFDRFALGLHVRNRYDRVIDATVCFLPKEVAVDILNFTRRFTIDNRLGVYNPDDNPEGLMRFLVIKTSFASGEVMVNLVTSREEPDVMKQYAGELTEAVPAVTSVVNNINGRRAQIAVGEYETLYHGTATIRDTIGSNTFRISANSFFQANTPQAERLYATAAEYAELKETDMVWDLYCGTGTISLFVADRVKQVLGIELVEAAIADARSNAISNGVTNAEFIASDLRHALTTPEFLDAHARPDAMIIDPPRSGMHPDVIREVLKLAPERIAYVSCNPATQARDCELLSDAYDLIELQPVDMFPQTFHIECVAKLRRKKN